MAKGTKTGGGSRKGKPNKISADLREMIGGALEDVGGREYLAAQAKANPSAFLTLIGKTLPKDVNNSHTGEVAVRHIGDILRELDGADTGAGAARSRRD